MIQVVILAAGQGRRMFSSLPKVLHPLGGKPLLEHVVLAAESVTNTQPIIVCGHQGNIVKDALTRHDLKWVEQKQQQGTAHAVIQALPLLEDDARIIVLCGDVPLIESKTLQRLVANTPEDALGMLTAFIANPYGYGRIVREGQEVARIIEEKDASASERKINEINPGVYLVPARFLKQNLMNIKNNNVQKEFYLTDLIALAASQGIKIHTEQPDTVEEILGVNDCSQLVSLERFYQKKLASMLIQQGVVIMDPARFDLRGDFKFGREVLIDINVILEGCGEIGDGCRIGANSILRNTILGDNVEIKPFSFLDGVLAANDCIIGPFARLRPGTVLHARAHIGNFVEVKNSLVGNSTKINHLSYIGDSEVGKNVNIGAGTITCNYDGKNKHKTVIGDDTHIGSGTQLVAPVTIGEGATIAAGSTITKDVSGHALTLTHKLEQRAIKAWQRPEKEKYE